MQLDWAQKTTVARISTNPNDLASGSCKGPCKAKIQISIFGDVKSGNRIIKILCGEIS